jgi:hypothetical protein
MKKHLWRAGAAAVVFAAAGVVTLSSCSDALLTEMTRLASESNLPQILPLDKTIITAHETITLLFTKSMDPATVTLSGNIGDTANVKKKWDTKTLTNDSYILNTDAAVFWTPGTGKTLTITVTSAGQTVSYSYTFDVFNGVCVAPIDHLGNATTDGNPGTALLPILHIGAGISGAVALYPSGAREVHVAAGTYLTNWQTSTNMIQAVKGVSLYGGYKTDWSVRDTAANPTIIQDQSGSGTPNGPYNCAIYAGGLITTATVIDGFEIDGGLGTTSAAIYCRGGSPTISNNTINAGGNFAGETRNAILLDSGTLGEIPSPHIIGNSINTAASVGGIDLAECYGININSAGSPIIEGNRIRGGSASILLAGTGSSYGILDGNPTELPVIRGNEISSGTARYSFAVYLSGKISPLEIYNNLILSSNAYNGTADSYGLYIYNCSPVIRNNSIIVEASCAASTNYGAYMISGSHATLQNNLFEVLDTNHTTYSVWEASGSTLTLLKNNHLYNAKSPGPGTIYYRAATSTSYTDITTLEGALGGSVAAANAGGDPLLTASYAPTSSSPLALRTGALDGAALLWSFATDRNGANRTGNGATGWSMGCYEY